MRTDVALTRDCKMNDPKEQSGKENLGAHLHFFLFLKCFDAKDYRNFSR